MSHNINNSSVSNTDANLLSNNDNINAINLTAYNSQQHQGLINAVVSVLQAPTQPTMVSKQYSNERNVATEVQAYAKISGRDWTYYVKELEVSIGRNTDNAANLNAPLPPPSSSSNGKNDITINIDLGPAKVVSRKHAVIKFNMQHGGWELLVLGRNGAKVNFKRVQAGPSAPPVLLASGAVLDIGGTQMMFILPDQEPFVSQSCVNHLIPKLVAEYGNGISNTNANDVNALLYDILRESDYVKQHRQQQPLQQQVRTFKMYGNNGNNNQNNNHGGINNASQFPNGPQFMNDPSSAVSHSTGGLLLSPDISSNNQNMMNESYSVSNSSATHMGFPQALDFASDLSRDENRNVKPPHSYATMITQAILSTKEGVISLADIYKYISSNYAYYRFAKTGWQNSIRHNLSLNKAFEKVPRRPNEPGKGMKWRISEDYQRDFLNKWNAGKIGKVRRGSSVARQLQLHLSKFNTLPAQQDYTPEPTIIKQQSMGRNRMASLDQTSQFDTPLSASSDSSSLSHSNLSTLAPVQQQQQQPQPIINQSVQQQQQQHQYQPVPSNAMPPPTSVSRVNSNPTNNALISFTNTTSASATTAPATAASSSFQSNLAPVMTTMSSSNSELSPSHGSLLRSPTKAFHITAMEAYTPERGSAQQTRSPPISNMNVHNSTAEETETIMDEKNTKSGAGNHENQNDKVSAGRSSPGVWNLLQFSSVNNTPAVNSIEKNNANKSLGNRSTNNATNVANMVDLEPKDVASSPLKRQDNQKNGKELMLDTEGAKISIVNE